jgi:hypothetical protein
MVFWWRDQRPPAPTAGAMVSNKDAFLVPPNIPSFSRDLIDNFFAVGGRDVYMAIPMVVASVKGNERPLWILFLVANEVFEVMKSFILETGIASSRPTLSVT